jgi:hypothetical protein
MSSDSSLIPKGVLVVLPEDLMPAEIEWLNDVAKTLVCSRRSGFPATVEQRDAALKFLAVMLRKSGGSHGRA